MYYFEGLRWSWDGIWRVLGLNVLYVMRSTNGSVVEVIAAESVSCFSRYCSFWMVLVASQNLLNVNVVSLSTVTTLLYDRAYVTYLSINAVLVGFSFPIDRLAWLVLENQNFVFCLRKRLTSTSQLSVSVTSLIRLGCSPFNRRMDWNYTSEDITTNFSGSVVDVQV